MLDGRSRSSAAASGRLAAVTIQNFDSTDRPLMGEIDRLVCLSLGLRVAIPSVGHGSSPACWNHISGPAAPECTAGDEMILAKTKRHRAAIAHEQLAVRLDS